MLAVDDLGWEHLQDVLIRGVRGEHRVVVLLEHIHALQNVLRDHVALEGIELVSEGQVVDLVVIIKLR